MAEPFGNQRITLLPFRKFLKKFKLILGSLGERENWSESGQNFPFPSLKSD